MVDAKPKVPEQAAKPGPKDPPAGPALIKLDRQDLLYKHLHWLRLTVSLIIGLQLYGICFFINNLNIIASIIGAIIGTSASLMLLAWTNRQANEAHERVVAEKAVKAQAKAEAERLEAEKLAEEKLQAESLAAPVKGSVAELNKYSSQVTGSAPIPPRHDVGDVRDPRQAANASNSAHAIGNELQSEMDSVTASRRSSQENSMSTPAESRMHLMQQGAGDYPIGSRWADARMEMRNAASDVALPLHYPGVLLNHHAQRHAEGSLAQYPSLPVGQFMYKSPQGLAHAISQVEQSGSIHSNEDSLASSSSVSEKMTDEHASMEGSAFNNAMEGYYGRGRSNPEIPVMESEYLEAYLFPQYTHSLLHSEKDPQVSRRARSIHLQFEAAPQRHVRNEAEDIGVNPGIQIIIQSEEEAIAAERAIAKERETRGQSASLI